MNDGLPPLREVIKKHQLSARKSFGQNFLLDLNLTDKIARQAGDLTGHNVIEVGPGPGGLTRALLFNGAKHVFAIEKDERCLPVLEEIEAAYPGRLTVLMQDAMQPDWIERVGGDVKIVSNLPYNVGTQLLLNWLTHDPWPPFWNTLTLMFQREVAERITAKPGSKAFGRLSVLAAWRSRATRKMMLPPEAFTPPPKVTSSVVHFERLDEPAYPAELKKLELVTATAFSQRRKMLRASLKGLLPNATKELEALGIDPSARAESLDVSEFCKISNLL